MTNSEEKSLGEKVNIATLPPNKKLHYSLDKNTDWVKELLMELNENAKSRSEEDYLMDTFLDVELEIKKLNNPTFGDVLICNGNLKTEYVTECVRTLVEMRDHLEVEFKTCFIPDHFAEEPEYEDQTDIFIDNDVHELHFYSLKKANLKEMVHEQIYLNINQYPVADYDAPLHYAKETSGTKQ